MPNVFYVDNVTQIKDGLRQKDPNFVKLRYYPMLISPYPVGAFLCFDDNGVAWVKKHEDFRLYTVADGKRACWTRIREEGNGTKTS